MKALNSTACPHPHADLHYCQLREDSVGVSPNSLLLVIDFRSKERPLEAGRKTPCASQDVDALQVLKENR